MYMYTVLTHFTVTLIVVLFLFKKKQQIVQLDKMYLAITRITKNTLEQQIILAQVKSINYAKS